MEYLNNKLTGKRKNLSVKEKDLHHIKVFYYITRYNEEKIREEMKKKILKVKIAYKCH